jgi:hypothetical protein
VLCNLIGRDVENGEIPDDEVLIGPMIRNICYANARQYLAIPDVPAGVEAPNRLAKRSDVAAASRRRRSANQ